MIDPADMTDLLDSLRADHGLVGTERRAPRAAVCADIYTRCVNTQTTIKEVVANDFPWCSDFIEQLASLFRGYVAHKRAARAGRLRRSAAAVAGGAGRPGRRPGPARPVRRGARGRVPGRQRRAGGDRAAAQAGRDRSDLCR